MSYSSHILGYLYIIKGDTFIMNTKIDISKNMATQNSNFPILAVSNRHLAAHPFLDQIERVCQAHPAALILREKDLPAEDYKTLAIRVLPICQQYNVSCILHTFWQDALALGCTCIHLPLPRASQPCRCRWNRLGKTGRFFRHRHLRPLRGRSAGSRKARRNVRCRRAHLCDRLQKRTCTPRSEVPSDCVQVRIAAGLWHRRY